MSGNLNKTKINKICKHCKENFKIITGSKFANHVRWCNKNHERNNSNCKLAMGIVNKYGELCKFNVICKSCNKKFIIEERKKQHPKKEKYFCSRSCANKRNHTIETKNKISKSNSIAIKNKWANDKDYAKKVLQNNIYFTSKGERLVRDYFINSYPDEEWTFGGNLTYNNISGITRDLYSNKLKICIEYDGIWHFKDIKGQLKSKQEKDKALEMWCLDNNYKLIRIQDELFQNDPEKWLIELREYFNDKNSIIKLGDIYH